MNAGRLLEVFRVEFAHNARRPLFWMLILILGFFAFLMPSGQATISSGNAAVGGTKAWITSEFAVSQLLILLVNILYAFFISVAAGMAVIRDQDLKIGELLHSSPLKPSEYVWGKFLAHFASFACVLFLHIGLMIFFNHVVPHPGTEIIGPLVLGNYLRPALTFGLPTILFYAGTAFAFGEWTRKPILVFVLPVVNRPRVRVVPLGLVAVVAQPHREQLAHVDRSRGSALAGGDVAQGRQGRRVLQPRPRRLGSAVRDQPSGVRADRRRARGVDAGSLLVAPARRERAVEEGARPGRAGTGVLARFGRHTRADSLARDALGLPRLPRRRVRDGEGRAEGAAQHAGALPVRADHPAPDAGREISSASARSTRRCSTRPARSPRVS
jgi:hypothetical protein